MPADYDPLAVYSYSPRLSEVFYWELISKNSGRSAENTFGNTPRMLICLVLILALSPIYSLETLAVDTLDTSAVI